MGLGYIPKKDSSGNPVNTSSVFANKDNYNFRGTGLKQTITSKATYKFQYTITYPQVEFNGLEFFNAQANDTAALKIIDDANGTYSTVPNYVLNQFGYTWNIGKTQYNKQLPYNATLYAGMIIEIEYYNDADIDVEICVNFDIHEVKQ